MKSILEYLPSLACIVVAGAALLTGRSDDGWGLFLLVGLVLLPDVREIIFG